MALGPSLTVESVLMAVVVVCVVAAVSSRWAWAWGREAESKRGGDGDWVHEEEAAPATTAASDAAKENVVADCRVVAEKDLAKANKLFDKALRAYSRIEYMEERGEVLLSSLPAALQAEMDEVVAMWTEAAAQGHMMAQAHLGELYNTGRGVKLDLERAVAFYTQAANQGNLGCQYQLGIKTKDPYAQCELGSAYRDGKGVPQSYERAKELYKKSVAGGNFVAMDLLTAFYLEEKGGHFGEALRLQEIKASMGGGQDYSCGESQRGVLGLRALVKRTCPLLYKQVELQGLNTPALNGTRGIAFGFSYTERRSRGIMQMLSIPGSLWVIASGRYSVVLDVPGPDRDQKLVKVKPTNLVEVAGEVVLNPGLFTNPCL